MSLGFGKFRFLLRSVLGFLAVFFFMGSTNSFAYIQMPWTNPNGVKYKINDTSFTTNLNGSSLTKAEGRYWVQTGLSKWTTQTGLDFDIDYQGTTTAGCNVYDGQNTVVVSASANPGNLATMFERVVNGVLVEWDICIWGGNAAKFEAATSNTEPTGEWHILNVMVHEWGHVLGLRDIPGTTAGGLMHGGVERGNNGANLFGDDIKGVRVRHPGLRPMGLRSYWRHYSDLTDSWNPRHSISNTNYFRPIRATIGKAFGTSKVIGTGLVEPNAVSPSKIKFFAADYPLTYSTTWNTNFYTEYAWDSPAIASNNTGTFVAALPLKTEYARNGCSGMKFYRSTNGFVTASTYSYSNMCSMISPAIAWNSHWQKWIIVWSDYDPIIEENTNRMMYSTSSDGSFWATPKVLGRFTNATPGLACHYGGECVLTYVRGSDFSPNVVARKVTFNSAGVISLGSYTEYQNFIQREVSVGAKLGNKWLTGWSYKSSGDWKSKGWGSMYTKFSSSNPPTGSTASVGESAEHPGSIAAAHDYYNAYLFYVD